jgi:hypothetical protein
MSWETPLWQPNRKTVWGAASPILIIGIFVFVLPYFNGVGNLNFPSWLGWLGGVIMMIGVLHSVIKVLDNER